jgi:integrase
MIKNGIPYVTLRNGVYQYVRRVPAAVKQNALDFRRFFNGIDPFRRSLGTKDRTEAFAAASIVNHEFERCVSAALEREHKVLQTTLRVPTAHDLGQIASSIREEIINDFGRTIIAAKTDDNANEYLDWRFENEAEENAKLQALKDDRSLRATEKEEQIAEDYITRLGLNVTRGSAMHGAVLTAVREGWLEGKEAISEMLEGRVKPKPSSSPLIVESLSQKIDGNTSKLFSEVAEIQNAQKAFPGKTLQKRKRAHGEFIKITGDKPIQEIERRHVAHFVEQIAARKVGGLERPISKQTLQSYKSAVSSVIGFAIDRDWRHGPNPADGIDLDAYTVVNKTETIVDYRRFFERELVELFALPRFVGCASTDRINEEGELLLRDSRFWVPVVALYTGARDAELGGLQISDVRFTPVPYLVLADNQQRSIKGKQGQDNSRKVPILDVLMELGFSEYIARLKAAGETLVFPDWEPYQAASGDLRWSNSAFMKEFHRNVRDKLFPKKPGDSRSPLRFYSFRGAFKKLLLGKGNKLYADVVLGHQLQDLDDRYVGSIEIEELHDLFRALRYEAVDIPTRK